MIPHYTAERAQQARDFLEAWRSGAVTGMWVDPEDLAYMEALAREGKRRGDLG